MGSGSEAQWVRRLLDVGRALTGELDQRVVLDRVLQTAQEITGARYAALGILNEQHTELAEFLTAGVGEATRRAIGDLPRGRGVLGALIDQPRPLRLTDVGQHPSSYGFPLGHPQMRGFLGVPVLIRGHVWGNLYLAEKLDGQFSESDEEAAVILAEWAGIAIENARLYETSERRRAEMEKACRGLQATHDVAIAIGSDVALEHVLELIAKRGRSLVEARRLVIMLRDRRDLVVLTSAGDVGPDVGGLRLSISESTSGQVLESQCSQRIADVGSQRFAPRELCMIGSRTALFVPMIHRGEAVGVLAAFDRSRNERAFTADDEQMLLTFAASAATAVTLAQSVQADRLRSSFAAADAERRRWARELHDETLQSLGALRVLLSGALRLHDLPRAQAAMRQAIEHLARETENLRSIITDLRPAALEELGLKAAIEALLDRHAQQSHFELQSEISLSGPETGTQPLPAELESATYRLVQEALTNVVKHAHAKTVHVSIAESVGSLLIKIQDDGSGFDTSSNGHGFGLAGMRERVHLAGGTLSIQSGKLGTVLTACLPTAARATLPWMTGARDRLHPDSHNGDSRRAPAPTEGSPSRA
jgi:signal transduction histidine kinase